MAGFILFKLICCTITVISNILSSLLRKLTTCLLVVTIKAFKLPGPVVQSAMEEIGRMIRCYLEHLLVSVLKNIVDAIKTFIGLFFNLVVEIVSRSVTTTMERAGAGLVKKFNWLLMELMAACWKVVLKTMTKSIRLFFELVVDVISRSTKELGEKTTSIFHELMKLVMSYWNIILDISNNVVVFYNLLVEVVPRWLVVAEELIDQMMSAFNEWTELLKNVAAVVRGDIEQLPPVAGELIKWVAGLFYDRVVDFVVKFVKQVFFGLVFGSVVMTSVYGELIEQVFENVTRNVVENVMAMLMYLWNRQFVR